MSLWPKPLFGDEVVLRSIDWLENFPWRSESAVRKLDDKYEICLHIKDFAPEHISVKIKDGFLIIEGKHEEKREEHAYVSRSFIRRYPLPDDCRINAVESKLTQEGILTVVVPRKPVAKRDTVIPVSVDKPGPKSKL